MGGSQPGNFEAAFQASNYDIHGRSGWACDISLALRMYSFAGTTPSHPCPLRGFIMKVDIGRKHLYSCRVSVQLGLVVLHCLAVGMRLDVEQQNCNPQYRILALDQ